MCIRDRHYPFLKLTTNEEFPRLVVARRVQKDGAAYYGPFYPATAMRETLRLTRQLFPLRTCRIKIDGGLERPCIQYYIHRCNAPCTGWETKEGYAKTVREVQSFLEGKNEELAKVLTRYAKDNPAFTFRAGLVDGRVVSVGELQALAALPSKEELYSKLLWLLQAPAQRLVSVLSAPARQVAVVVDRGVKENKFSQAN